MKLTSSTGLSTIGASASSQVFQVTEGYWNLYVTGTPATSTLTLKWCRTKDGTFVTYCANNSAGTPTNFTISSTQVASSSIGFRSLMIDSGMFFRFDSDANGSPAWQIDVNGPNVSPVAIST